MDTQAAPEGGKKVVFAAGEQLFCEGDASRDLYIIAAGQVEVYKTEGGVHVELDRVGPGEVIGELAAIDAGTRSASARALIPTTAVVIGWADLERTNSAIPEWFQKIARILAQRLREADKKIDNSVTLDKSRSVAACLHLMLPLHEDGAVLSLRMVEHECADILGLSPIDTMAALEQLVKKNVIGIDKNKVAIKNLGTLTQYALPILVPEQVPAAT